MPLALSTRHRLPSRSPADQYLPTGSHTHDRLTIPPDRLQISLSDPVLAAAEQHLANLSDRDDGARKTPKLRSVGFYPNSGFLSQTSGGDTIGAPQAATPQTMATQATSPDLSWIAALQGPAAHSWLDPADGSIEISEVMTIPSALDGYPDDPHGYACRDSQHDSDLAPLASETFKQELYIRGYLKRPASRPSNVIPRKSRLSLMFGSRNPFPKVIGRRLGRKVAECLNAEQDEVKIPSELDVHPPDEQPSISISRATLRTPQTDDPKSYWLDSSISTAELLCRLDAYLAIEQSPTPVSCATLQTPPVDGLRPPRVTTNTSIAERPCGRDAHLSEEQPSASISRVTLRTPQTDGFESPSVDTTPSAPELFDLHEFSYLTALTTPPSSPSTVLDAETFKKRGDLNDSKRAV